MGYTATYPRQQKTHPTAKNRVWGFFADPNKTRPANRLQPPELRRKIDPTTTKPVSGVFFYGYRYYNSGTGRWPSRDPIGEKLGQNESVKWPSVITRDSFSLLLELVIGVVNWEPSKDINLYSFVTNDPITSTDVQGLHVYKIDRKLGAKPGEEDTSRCPCNPLTHTFIVVVNEDGTAVAYSWGNSANKRGWNNPNQDEDIDGTLDAFNKGNYEEVVGDHSKDQDVHDAFERIKDDPDSNHSNKLLYDNCKNEADKLLEEAGIEGDQPSKRKTPPRRRR